MRDRLLRVHVEKKRNERDGGNFNASTANEPVAIIFASGCRNIKRGRKRVEEREGIKTGEKDTERS